MTTSSSSSSRSRRSVYGVPTKCWCGKGLIIWASETKENPFRRFYRCEIALQRKSESHLFKWEDEAILDEIKMVDAKISDIVHDFQSLSKSVIEQLDSHKNWMMSLESDLMSKLNEHFEKQNQAVDEANRQPIVPGHNFAAAVAIVGTIAWMYWKFL
ncbi:uncharacterized protein At4g04775-like [Raphanus sativus]|uniref:Uncharacterized protein At4g04775-like n=1 Tax=Raphanus sativus TaxID=3726 RepID=A0A6J0N5R8_RAPSA|nr:uncharacterized protein At4g04775-like [Raphanus sativus]